MTRISTGYCRWPSRVFPTPLSISVSMVLNYRCCLRNGCSPITAPCGRFLAVLSMLLPDDSVADEAVFAFGMMVSHENQYDETLLQALNLCVGAELLHDTSYFAERSWNGRSVGARIRRPVSAGRRSRQRPVFVGQ